MDGFQFPIIIQSIIISNIRKKIKIIIYKKSKRKKEYFKEKFKNNEKKKQEKEYKSGSLINTKKRIKNLIKSEANKIGKKVK